MAARSAPQIIHIKRKRDSAPVDQLYLEADIGKRRRVHDSFVFKRVERLILPLPARTQIKTHNANGIPVVQSTAPGTEVDDPFALRQASNGSTGASYCGRERIGRAQRERAKEI